MARMNARHKMRPLLVTLFVLVAAAVVVGQAGRRLPKRIETPPPSASAPEPAPSPKPPPKAQFTLKVVSDIAQTAYLLFPFPERMQTWAVAQLAKSPLLEVNLAATANRRQASELAKAETTAFVVWLQLEDDPLGKGDNVGHRPASGEVWINYSIFSPGSGKAKSSGRVVLSQQFNSSVEPGAVIHRCNPDVRGDDYLLMVASFEVAVRVMHSLGVRLRRYARKSQTSKSGNNILGSLYFASQLSRAS